MLRFYFCFLMNLENFLIWYIHIPSIIIVTTYGYSQSCHGPDDVGCELYNSTHISPCGGVILIDCAIISEPSSLLDCSVCPPLANSDHKGVSISLRYQAPKHAARIKHHPIWKYNLILTGVPWFLMTWTFPGSSGSLNISPLCRSAFRKECCQKEDMYLGLPTSQKCHTQAKLTLPKITDFW